MEYNTDINMARIGYDVHSGGYFNHIHFTICSATLDSRVSHYSGYSPAYVYSNENLRAIIDFVQPAGKTVLSVAASGDMPLFLTAYDAVHVDTFDISYNAGVIMDIKTYILQKQITYLKYRQILQDLRGSSDLLSGVYGDMVRHAVTSNTVDYLHGMRGCRILYREDNCFPIYPLKNQEFNDAKQKIHGRYNFIWSDVLDLYNHVRGKRYDIIYLSNVFQYVRNVQDMIKTLNDLRKVLNKDGVMVVDSLLPKMVFDGDPNMSTNERIRKYNIIGQAISNWAELIYDKKAMSLFLKTK